MTNKPRNQAVSFDALRELIRDFAFVCGLVVLGAVIHHQPEYFSSARAAIVAKWCLLLVALVYGTFSGLDFWRKFASPYLPRNWQGNVASVLGTAVLTLAFELVVFAAADFGDNSWRLSGVSQDVSNQGTHK